MPDKVRYLTKSRFKKALECPGKLYYYGKDKYPSNFDDNDFMMALAEGGFQVGELARYYYPGGHDIKALDYEPESADVFNLASGVSYSVEEIVDFTKEIIDGEIDVNYLNEYRPNEVLDTVATISKAKELLGWEPEVDIREGIKRIINE